MRLSAWGAPRNRRLRGDPSPATTLRSEFLTSSGFSWNQDHWFGHRVTNRERLDVGLPSALSSDRFTSHVLRLISHMRKDRKNPKQATKLRRNESTLSISPSLWFTYFLIKNRLKAPSLSLHSFRHTMTVKLELARTDGSLMRTQGKV